MNALHDVIALIRKRIARYQGESLNEQNTKATLIAPLLRALGWDVEDLEEVHREYRHHPSDNPVDYAALGPPYAAPLRRSQGARPGPQRP